MAPTTPNRLYSVVLECLHAARRSGLWQEGARILVAASAGADSTALAHALAGAREALGLAALALGHVDHGLRPDSADDAAAVAALAEALGLPFHLTQVQVRGKGGVQAAARRARYAALEAQRAQGGYTHVATAHTADDQAETLLLRIARGTHPRGLAGIPARRGPIIRPLLACRRADLRAFCDAHGLPVREDPSNRDPRFRRVRVREEVLPLLAARLNPAVVEALGRLARLAGEDEALLADQARDLARSAAGPFGLLNARVLAEAAPALARRVLAEAWREAADPDLDPVEAAQVEGLLELVRGEGPRSRRTLPGGVIAERSLGWLAFSPFPAISPRPLAAGRHALGAGRVVVRALEAGEVAEAGETALPRAPGLVLRGPLPGDRLGDARLARRLSEARIPASIRGGLPVIALGERVVWVAELFEAPSEAPGEAAPAWAVRCESGPAGSLGTIARFSPK